LLVISSMIGSGVFKKIAPMSSQLMDNELVLLAWLVAGMFTLFGVFSYAGLASISSEAGGQLEYFRLIYGNFFAFLNGWANFSVIQSASIASIAYVFAESVHSVVPLPEPFAMYADLTFIGLHPFANSGVKLLAVVTIIVLTVINYFGVEQGGRVNNIFTLAKIAGILFLIGIGWNYASPVADVNPQGVSTGLFDSGQSLLAPFFLALLSAFWAYDGWVNVTYIAGEVKNPQRNIPIAIILGTASVMLLYLLLNMSFLRVMSAADYAALDAQGDQIAGVQMAVKVLGDQGRWIIALLIMLCTFGATNASLMSGARIYYRMANTGMFIPKAGKAHPRYQTPHVALFMQMVWSCVLVFSGTFDQLTDMLIFASFLFYGSGALGLIILKRRQVVTTKVIGYPLVPIIFVLFCLVLIGNTLVSMPQESITGLVLIAAGTPLYFIFRRK
jgi:basic amino acid/polyamine antiporter, APA family